MAKNWLNALEKLDKNVLTNLNPHENPIRTLSPSLNFIFGKGHGLPRGYTAVFGGPPKGGKTLVTNAFAGWIHQNDPEAFVIKFNTEMREFVQATPEELQRTFGIDPKRYKVYQTNDPVDIFDKIEKDFEAQCQDGLPLVAVIIDSINSIKGLSAQNADSVENQFIGDDARTLGRGFKRILNFIRKNNVALLCTSQVRVEMDQLEQKRGNKVKFAIPFALAHAAEYFIYVEPNRNKDAKQDIEGNEYRRSDMTDMDKNSKGELVAHKIKVTMKDSSCGPKGRVAEFTLHQRKGIINQWEEVYTLCSNRGIIENPKLGTYKFGDKEWRGKEAVWEDLKNNQSLQDAMVAELFKRDREEEYALDVSAGDDEE